jgi:hypothetical protein
MKPGTAVLFKDGTQGTVIGNRGLRTRVQVGILRVSILTCLLTRAVPLTPAEQDEEFAFTMAEMDARISARTFYNWAYKQHGDMTLWFQDLNSLYP